MTAERRTSLSDLWSPDQPLPGGRVLQAVARRCGEMWRLPDLGSSVRVGYNPRMRTTLGRAMLTEGRVELNTRLLREHPDQLLPTLVHELAHIATHRRYGRVAPHGREFKTLMAVMGMTGEATHELPVAHLRQKRRKYIYIHRCSECGGTFPARKVRRDTYCAKCGPQSQWSVLRIPNTELGRERIRQLLESIR